MYHSTDTNIDFFRFWGYQRSLIKNLTTVIKIHIHIKHPTMPKKTYLKFFIGIFYQKFGGITTAKQSPFTHRTLCPV
jgi:hypothetical protein